jgi:predicted ester cyclase
VEEVTVSTDECKQVVRRYYEEVFTQRNLAALDELFTADFVGYSATLGTYSLTDMRREIAREHTDMPADEMIIEEQVADGDRVMTRCQYRWKHDQPVFGELPSGQWLVMEGIHLDRLLAKKIAERWEVKDFWGVVTRLGGKASFPDLPQS